ncbi:MAG: ArsR family transcriptional regulator [Nitrospirae bacterium]|nr:MAG: ArsR family transcriptional regulator [Nitrospirota bacterium]
MNNQVENIARVLKVLGDPNRLGIVFAIGKESRSVTELIRITGLSQTLVSFHLRALRNAEIVRTRREGPFIYYSLKEPGLIDILTDLFRLVETPLKEAPIEHFSAEMAGKGGK